MGSVMDCKLNPCCGDRLSCFGKPKPKQFNQAKKPEFVDGCAKARAAVERLANVQMNISLAEWSELSASILAALPAPSALENGPAGLADAPSKSPSPDLSSLRKGAEVMREAIEDAVEKLNTYRGAAVQTVIDQLEAALVSGSREDRDG